MKKLGEKIKNIRRSKGLTQNELAEGICTQATVSNLENGASLPSVTTLLAIADRLKINFSEISDYMPTNDNSFIEIFNQVKALCNKGEYKKAQTLLKKSIKLDKLERDYEIKEYYYYLGLTSLVGEGNYSDAHYNFNLALFSESCKKLDIIDVLTTNGIAVAYFLNDELDKAHVYFTKSIAQLEELRSAGDHLLDSMEVIKIYFNTAKYYSATENYKKAIEFCTIGIKLQQKEDKMHGLENLLYEKAHNLFKLENVKEAEDYYFHALSVSMLNKNDELTETLKKELAKNKINSYSYK